MTAPFTLSATLQHPAAPAGVEPAEPLIARLRVQPESEQAARPLLDLCFVIDSSASMHHFELTPDQRAHWQQRAESRGEVTRQRADGRTGLIWTGQTLRELQRHVSTPMLSSLRGIWQCIERLDPADRISLVAFADRPGVLYEDGGCDQAHRLEQARRALATLGSGVDQSGLGRGTRLAGALQHAVERLTEPGLEPRLRRLVLISDGIIEDGEICLPHLDRAAEAGLVISVVGVGDEFDEEHLMRVTDLGRGNYYYAATAPEAERALGAELDSLTRVVAREARLWLRPHQGTVLRDFYSSAPSTSSFQTMWVQDGRWSFRLGDLPADHTLDYLLFFCPPAGAEGQADLVTATLTALPPGSNEPVTAEAKVHLYYSDDERLLQAVDDEVSDAARRLEVYLEERKAAQALAAGDSETATRHLRAATRMLRTLGDSELAAEMDVAAAEAESGTRNLGREKRVKAGTRKLGAAPSGGADPAATRVAAAGSTRSLGSAGGPGEPPKV